MFKEIELKEKGKISRLTNKTFCFDPRISEGFYSANYFLKSSNIVKKVLPNHIVTMQFFQRKERAFVCGLDESIALIHTFAKQPKSLLIEALNDGDQISGLEPVLKITGKYENFGFLESLIDGILARRTSVCTNVKEILEVAGNTPVFSMADRQDDYLTQIGDGYASYVAGIRKVSTNAQGYYWNGFGMGTMPHALIQVCSGDLCKAADAYLEVYPESSISALVDYNNDVITDSLKLFKHLGKKLSGVRVDTSISLCDKYFDNIKNKEGLYGVSAELILALRKHLDAAGGQNVQIIVSSSFSKEKIAEWVKRKVPVDMYGVGTSFVNNMTCGFTGDLVMLDGKPEAKVGRSHIHSERLVRVPYPIY